MELDYQTALLLQYQLERAHKRKEDTTSDHQLALQLQDQFNTEELVERPVNNLVYKAPTNANPAKCLVDPSWEVIDPTPDIHVLFTAFDQKFFWSSLGSVTVSWSKRMTSCAGVCTYQGRGGMCSITLSEPLLKLRPRKDLVETLLHEMIHAYLFVTANNRDRDGHGPEFHRHMYRINAEAGTNITVYHDFHDEVKLYQQHWWRCNGPCQQWHPYFGMVRRATNRPPGPNDRWWNDHASRCGGSFIKVKSPEGAGKPSKASKEKLPKTQSTTDIRKYITTSTTNSPLKASTSNTAKNPSNENNTAPLNRQNSLPANVHTVGNPSVSKPQVSNVIPSQTSNIFGFSNLSKSSSKKPRGNTAIKNAGSSTFLVTNKKSNSSSTKENESQRVAASGAEPFAGSGRSLGAPSSTKLSDYSAVREHWLKKFENSTKRPPTGLSSPALVVAANKRAKIEDDRVECPVCAKHFKPEDVNAHLDQCLQDTETNKECIVCSYSIPAPEYEAHVARCSSKHFKDAEKENEEAFTKKCPACDACVPKDRYNTHLQNCLLGLCEDFEEKYSDTTTTSCLACGKDIVKSDLDAHLENCMSMSNVFDTTNVPIEEKEDDGKKESSFNCPFCMELIEEGEMKAHIDGCLRQANEEKNALVISICDSDSD